MTASLVLTGETLLYDSMFDDESLISVFCVLQ